MPMSLELALALLQLLVEIIHVILKVIYHF